MQKRFAPVLILVGILVIMAVTSGVYFLGKLDNTKTPTQNPTTVSQTPQPIIIRQPTPTSDETANWKTYTYKNISFQ